MLSHHARQTVKQPSSVKLALPLTKFDKTCICLHAVSLEGRDVKLLRDMTAAAEQAAIASPKCGDLKVTLNIGKATQVAPSCHLTDTAQALTQCSCNCHFAILWLEQSCSSAENCAVCVVMRKCCCLLQAHSSSMLGGQCKCLNISLPWRS